jgi:hypothetical protein
MNSINMSLEVTIQAQIQVIKIAMGNASSKALLGGRIMTKINLFSAIVKKDYSLVRLPV